MRQIFKFFLIFLTISTFCCKSKKGINLVTDKSVMEEIFPSLIDSMYVEIMFAMRPPPLIEIFDSATKKSIIKSVDRDEFYKNEIRKELINLKKDSTVITIVINDTIHSIYEEEQLKLRFDYLVSEQTSHSGYKFDFYNKSQVAPFKIVLSSTYKPKTRYDLFEQVLKEISFSRILFNQEHNKGLLTSEYSCGGDCGNGYRIFIEKVNDRWIINKIEHAWVS